MSADEIRSICSNADMIVCGYAFTRKEDSNIMILQLQMPHHALVMSKDGDILETTMDDVELDIVFGYWLKNKKYMEESYA